MTFAETLHQNYPQLTKSEKKVADYIINSGEKIIYSTLSDIKLKANVGDATIVRFCQKLGFSGFSDLKIEIAKENFNTADTHTTTQHIQDESIQQLISVLQSTKNLLNQADLEAALALIQKARFIYIFGVGSSGNTSYDLETMFLRVGIQSKACVDPHMQAQVASLLSEEDLVIGFSLSGKTKDTFDSLTIAKQNHAKVIAITNNRFSPIASLADIILQTTVDEFLNGSSLEGKMSQLYLCNLLIKAYEQQNKIDPVALREKVLRSIIDKRID